MGGSWRRPRRRATAGAAAHIEPPRSAAPATPLRRRNSSRVNRSVPVIASPFVAARIIAPRGARRHRGGPPGSAALRRPRRAEFEQLREVAEYGKAVARRRRRAHGVAPGIDRRRAVEAVVARGERRQTVEALDELERRDVLGRA